MHTVNDKALARKFWDAGIPMYTDYLFPPLDEPAPATITPSDTDFVADEG